MSAFTKKYNETEMNNTLSQLLYPDESIVVAVYCVFINDTFSRYNKTFSGYVGVTDKKRLVGFYLYIIIYEQRKSDDSFIRYYFMNLKRYGKFVVNFFYIF